MISHFIYVIGFVSCHIEIKILYTNWIESYSTNTKQFSFAHETISLSNILYLSAAYLKGLFQSPTLIEYTHYIFTLTHTTTKAYAVLPKKLSSSPSSYSRH